MHHAAAQGGLGRSVGPAGLPSAFSPQRAASAGAQSALSQTKRAVEVKLRVPPDALEAVLACAREHLSPDPYADPSRGDGYDIHTLYFDTADLDVYFRNGPYRNAKYRVRRYGTESLVYLERKSKLQGHVRKHRTSVPLGELGWLSDGAVPPELWGGRWFRRRLETLRLGPVCQLSYDRTARVGVLEGQPIRFTLDRRVRCVPCRALQPPTDVDGVPVLSPGESIVEIKYTRSLPEVFQRMVEDLGLQLSPISKYRLAVGALGLPREGVYASEGSLRVA